jgi:hypothetical protein
LPRNRFGESRTHSGVRQNQSGVPRTHSGVRQNQSGVPRTHSGVGQNQSGTPRTRPGVGQNQSGTPRTRSGMGQNQSDTPRTHSGLRQLSAGIRRLLSGVRRYSTMLSLTVFQFPSLNFYPRGTFCNANEMVHHTTRCNHRYTNILHSRLSSLFFSKFHHHIHIHSPPLFNRETPLMKGVLPKRRYTFNS